MTDASLARAAGGAAPLTPSEIVFVHAERFAPKDTVLTDGAALLFGPGKVAVTPLAHAILGVALLANERAGTLRMAIRPRKALFGLVTTNPLVVEPTGVPGTWPAGSLEASLLEKLGGREQAADTLLYGVLEEDSGGPAAQVVHLVKESLVGRGLMEKREKVTMKLLRTLEIVPRPELEAIARATPWEPEEALLRDLQSRRPVEAAKLKKAVSGALSRRQESADD